MQVESFLKVNGSQSHLNHNWVIYLGYQQKGGVSMMNSTFQVMAGRGGYGGYCGEGAVEGFRHGSMYMGHGMIFEGLILLLIVIGIFMFFRSKNKHVQITPAEVTSPAIEALKMRFVKGEIDETEYMTKSELLKK